MRLYHGSNVEVRCPRLLKSDRRLDFGPGFYVTSSFEQAARWAALTARRRKKGFPRVSVYRMDERAMKALNVLEFSEASLPWLQYVGANRRGECQKDDFDIVIGPVANDNTMPVLKLFFSNVYTEEEAIRRLLPQNLKDQFAFKTQSALDCLAFCEVIEP